MDEEWSRRRRSNRQVAEDSCHRAYAGLGATNVQCVPPPIRIRLAATESHGHESGVTATIDSNIVWRKQHSTQARHCSELP